MLYLIISTIISTVLLLLSLNWFYLKADPNSKSRYISFASLPKIFPILFIINTYYNYSDKNKLYIFYSFIIGYILYNFIPFFSCPIMKDKGPGLIYIPNFISPWCN